MKEPTFEEVVDGALKVFRREYQDTFPTGGDESDHEAATRAGLEAVVMSVPIKCPNCGEFV